MKISIPKNIYKQTLACTAFGISYCALVCGDKMLKYFENNYDILICHIQEGINTNSIDENAMEKGAKEFLSKKEFPQEWQEKFDRYGTEIVNLGKNIEHLDVGKLDKKEMLRLLIELDEWTEKMWTISIFIDMLDPGYDIEEIKRISKKYDLSEKEAELLLKPIKTPYFSQYNSSTAEEKSKEYYWINTTFAGYGKLTEKEMISSEEEPWDNPKSAQEKLLVEKNLEKNPLEMLRITTEWRDDRKRYGYISLHAFYMLLREIFRREGISEELCEWLCGREEVLSAAEGKIDVEELKERKKKCVIVCQGPGINIYTGKKAQEIEKELAAAEKQDLEEVYGSVASKGKAIGIVRVVRRTNHVFMDGDVLVTSMTRPEHVPLMKKAAAIVTDEGGITSHAAIVSRELGIPCVIGTKVATSVFKEGDLVEVNANHGVVRKIQ